MSERENIYNGRLNPGDVVYFVEGEGLLGLPGDDPLSVKKGVVEQTTFKGELLRNPLINLDSKHNLQLSEGKSLPISTSLKPAIEVFTSSEVAFYLEEISPAKAQLPIDELIDKDPKDADVITALGGAVVSRMLDDRQ